MKNQKQAGFSLIELLIVVVVISVIAAIAVPSLQKAIGVAENSSTLSLLRTMFLTQSLHYSQKNRFGRLDEINAIQNGNFGTVINNEIQRNKFKIEMIPANPDDTDLQSEFIIKATRTVDAQSVPYVITISQSGQIVQDPQ